MKKKTAASTPEILPGTFGAEDLDRTPGVVLQAENSKRGSEDGDAKNDTADPGLKEVATEERGTWHPLVRLLNYF